MKIDPKKLNSTLKNDEWRNMIYGFLSEMWPQFEFSINVQMKYDSKKFGSQKFKIVKLTLFQLNYFNLPP